MTTPTIQGDNVTLRPFRASDVDPLFNSLDDAETNRLTGTHATFTREQVERYVANFATDDSRVGFV
ncbi:MAG: N-acetyltransferase, partial [Chloroflexota bacterium]